MHPNPLFRIDDRASMRKLVDKIGFGMIFLTTPEGPRVAHTPLLWSGEDRLQFHLARHNVIAPHLEGAKTLATVNGPHGYISPRWYENRNTVPTWDYVAVEMEGHVRRLGDQELEAFLQALIARQERALPGDPWQATEVSDHKWQQLFTAITGFELSISDWRPTFKLSQKSSARERQAIRAGLEERSEDGLAAMISEPVA